MERLLSSSDIQKVTGIEPICYSDLYDIDDIEEHLPMVLLYDVCPEFGHWTCLFKRQNGDDPENYAIEFFDPCAQIPDDHNRNLGMHPDSRLLRLLDQTGRDIHYNNKRLQKVAPDINTCGRHVITRLYLSEIPIEEYVELFDGLDGDEIVVDITDTIESALS